MRTQKTASAFWTLFQSDLKHSETLPIEEALRHSAILGFTAIDAAINTYWQEVLVPDWSDHISLINIILENDDEMTKLHQSSKEFLRKSQLVAALRFISHTGEIEKFSPNFLDLAVICLLKKSQVDNVVIATQLVSLQAFRNQALHTGREWSEITAHNCIKNIKTCSEVLSRFHLCFADIFGHSHVFEQPKKHAA